ncbi:MAG TPA: sigma-70 family RNA polymerase sigma factor [Acidimicrobiales bacterium]|nr:sigma-70 family RNA polymerase sigma factor [Acidimicrobiales bacterium]
MPEPGDAWFDDALRRARAGEPAGFDALVRHLDPKLVGFARARGADDPEGLADDVLVQMCRSISTFEGNLAQLRAWVFTIARNRLIDERRRAGRRVDALPVEPGSVPETPVVDPASVGVEERERVERLLASLTDEQREVVVLRVIVGLSVEETARVVGRRAGAVRALQHRALRQLRAELVGEEE